MSDGNDVLVAQFKHWLRATMPKSGDQTVALYTTVTPLSPLAMQVFSVSTPLDALAERLLDWAADQWVDEEIAVPCGRGMVARVMRGEPDGFRLPTDTLKAWLRQVRVPSKASEPDGRTPFRIRRAWVVDANFCVYEWFGRKDRPVFIRDRMFMPCVRQVVPRRCTLHPECREPWKEDLAVVCAGSSVYEVTLMVQDTIVGCDERVAQVAEWIRNVRRRFQAPHFPPNVDIVNRCLDGKAVELYQFGLLTDERPRFPSLQDAIRHEGKVSMEGWDPKRVTLLEDWRDPSILTPEELIILRRDIAAGHPFVARGRTGPQTLVWRDAGLASIPPIVTVARDD